MNNYLIALFCSVSISIGQILFKLSADSAKNSGSFLLIKPLSLFMIAIIIYGMTSITWIWILGRVELSKVYPFMALAFLFVPLFSYYIFNEKFSAHYILGVLLIIIGVIFTKT